VSQLTSVVIPCYNGQEFLFEALASVRAQTEPVREIIVVDDGSAVPIHGPENWQGPPLQILRTATGGPSAARNHGLARASGEFIALLDADDAWHPRKIQAQESALRSDPLAIAAYTRCAQGPNLFAFGPYPPQDVSNDEFLIMLWYHSFFPPSSLMFRRSAVDAVGVFDEQLRGPEDIEYYFRLRTLGHFVQVPEALCSYRQHPSQFTANVYKRIAAWKRARVVMIERYGDALAGAGLRRDKLWDAYRNEVLLAFYRRQFGAARPLLWDYWRDHPRDLTVFRYALISLLPSGIIRRLRGELAAAVDADASGVPAPDNAAWWASEVARLTPVMTRDREVA
jgi:glycosyltransferase involved in cell wall biosynthesis